MRELKSEAIPATSTNSGNSNCNVKHDWVHTLRGELSVELGWSECVVCVYNCHHNEDDAEYHNNSLPASSAEKLSPKLEKSINKGLSASSPYYCLTFEVRVLSSLISAVVWAATIPKNA